MPPPVDPPPGTSLLPAASVLPDDDAVGLGEWFRPFAVTEDGVAGLIGETTTTGRVAERTDADLRAFPAIDEPAAGLFRPRTGEEGLVCLITPEDGGGLRCGAAWPLLPPGRGCTVRIDRLLVSPDRLVGFVAGAIEDGPALTWLDPFFVLHRASYASGDVARVALVALAHSCGPARPLPPVRLAADTPLGRIGEGAVRIAADGSIELSQDDSVAIAPVGEGPPCTFMIRGRVEGVHSGGQDLLGRAFHSLLVCVWTDAEDVLLRVILPDLAWPDPEPPRPGDMIEAVVLLQGRMLSHRTE